MSRRLFGALIGCSALLVALTAVGLECQRRSDTDGFVATAMVQGAAYLLGVALVRRCAASRAVVTAILGAALVMRILVVLAPPFLSSDIYRYVWDGRVIAAGINPYRHIPTDPQLAQLRDADIFSNINRNNYAPTIYPPAAEAIFFGVTRITESPTAMKAAMVGFEAVGVALLLSLLAASRQPATRIVVYAWHPLPLWEFAGSGHIDAALIAFVAAALCSRRTARGLAGVALAAATLIKFYPAVIFPALWRRWDWRLPTAFVAAVLLAYLPFVAVGWGVFGFLPHYFTEEGFNAGGAGFYWWNIAASVLPLGGVSALAYLAGAAGLLIALGFYVFFRPRDEDADLRAAALLAGAFMALLSPHYPWYFAWLIGFACLVPSSALVWLTLASLLLYLLPAWPQAIWDRERCFIESALYLPFLTLAAAELWQRHRREQARHGERALR